MKYIVLIYLVLASTTQGQEIYEGIDYTQPEQNEETFAPKEKSKTNLIGKSQVEFMLNASGSATSATLNYVVTPQLLVGVNSQRVNNFRNQSGGDLDSSQYFISDYGYRGDGFSIGAKYFLKDYGIQSSGVFFSGQIGRMWGKYSYNQDRYTRENGFVNNLVGDDKKLVESSTDESFADAEFIRTTVGYSLPFVDGILIKGVSLQLEGGLEQNTLPDSKLLSTKFGTRDIGADVKSSVYLGLGVAAYF